MTETERQQEQCANELRSVEEAHFAILYACIYADGEVSIQENERLINLFQIPGRFKGLGLISTWEHMRHLSFKYGFDVLVAASLSLIPQEMRLIILTEARGILSADGVISSRENQFLLFLKNKLD